MQDKFNVEGDPALDSGAVDVTRLGCEGELPAHHSAEDMRTAGVDVQHSAVDVEESVHTAEATPSPRPSVPMDDGVNCVPELTDSESVQEVEESEKEPFLHTELSKEAE